MIITNGDFKVYIHINKSNGKMYVGITSQKPEERWKNGTGYDTSPRFYNAIKKYGWDNFEHEIFADNLTEEEAHNIEKILINKLNLQNDKYGYNIKEGGNGGRIPLETRIKIGNANRGRKATEEARKRLSEAHKGVKLAPEHAKAIADANRGRPRTEKEKAAAIRIGMMKRGKIILYTVQRYLKNSWIKCMKLVENIENNIQNVGIVLNILLCLLKRALSINQYKMQLMKIIFVDLQ